MDILTHWDEVAASSPLGLVRLDTNVTALIPFTTDGEAVTLHYCEEKDIDGYVHCNGNKCVLCNIGRDKAERFLLPVYQPTSHSVGVLSIPQSSRPGGLRPQILPILKSMKRVAILVKKADRVKFEVAVVDIAEGMDDGAEVIAEYLRKAETGQIDLGSVYVRVANTDLAALPGVTTMLRLKGIDPEDVD